MNILDICNRILPRKTPISDMYNPIVISHNINIRYPK